VSTSPPLQNIRGEQIGFGKDFRETVCYEESFAKTLPGRITGHIYSKTGIFTIPVELCNDFS